MTRVAGRALCLLGLWLFLSGCSGTVGRWRQPQPLTVTSAVLPQAVLKEAYGGSRGVLVTASGGVAPYTWTWAAAAGSSLPPGLTLSSHPDSTGTISGIPTSTGPYSVMVTVNDSESPPKHKSEIYIITVAASTPSSQP